MRLVSSWRRVIVVIFVMLVHFVTGFGQQRFLWRSELVNGVPNINNVLWDQLRRCGTQTGFRIRKVFDGASIHRFWKVLDHTFQTPPNLSICLNLSTTCIRPKRLELTKERVHVQNTTTRSPEESQTLFLASMNHDITPLVRMPC